MSENPAGSDLPDDVADLADRLYLTSVHLLRRLRRADDDLELTGAQLSAITRLVAEGPMTPGELSKAEGVQPPTVTRLLQRLEAGGYVIRRADPDDGRSTRVAYTSKAFMALEAGRINRVATFGNQLAALPPGDRDKLVDALEVLEGLSRAPA